MICYYSITSLSTVGFGDFYPITNAERLMCSFILLFGVMIVSYILDHLIGYLIDFVTGEAPDFSDSELTRFFCLIKKLNYGNELCGYHKKKIHEFITIYHQKNKN